MTRGVIVVSAAILLSAQPFAKSASNQREVIVYGQVLFEPTRRPLKDVKVILERPNRSFFGNISRLGMEGVPQILGTTRTDAQGRFRFSITSSGPYDISCFRPGPHSGGGALNIRPPGPIIILYRADPTPFTLRPGQKPP